MIGRFCGPKLPGNEGNIVSSHNALYLWFHSDNSVSSNGFTLHWSTIDPVCGGVLEDNYGTIASPGSPGRYPPNRDCIWRINVADSKRIQFHFGLMMLEENCAHDYVEVNISWANQHAALRAIKSLCLIKSSFFLRTWLVIFYLLYSRYWILQIIIQLFFDVAFIVEIDSTFWITQITGMRDNERLGLYCNHTRPPPLITPDSEATVHFHSNGEGEDSGFQIHYSMIEGTHGNNTHTNQLFN